MADYWNGLNVREASQFFGADSRNGSAFFGDHHPEHDRQIRPITENKENLLNGINVNVRPISESKQKTEPLLAEDGKQKSAAIKQVIGNMNRLNVSDESIHIGRPVNGYRRPPPLPISRTDRLYQCSKLYAERRLKREMEIAQKERENRQFHSRKCPDFNKLNKKYKGSSDGRINNCTVPETPTVLKRCPLSKGHQPNVNLAPGIEKFKAREPQVLFKKPFTTKLERREIQPDPFDLKVSARLVDRKRYDNNYKKFVDDKRKEENERKRKEDERVQKLLRKQSGFKARPNPFK